VKAIASEDHALHRPAAELSGSAFIAPWECPARWEQVCSALLAAGHPISAPVGNVDPGLLGRVHAPDYLSFLESAWQRWHDSGATGDALPSVFAVRRTSDRKPRHIDGQLGHYAFATDVAITAGSWRAALSSAACADSARRLVSGGERAAFALCRPPGHHAGIDLYGGYCFLNNAAIAAQGLLDDGATRVAVLDIDFHHGNGTQDIFYARDDVPFASLHGDPALAFPYVLGYADETGQGAGEGFNLNLPLPEGCDATRWLQALDTALARLARLGCDALVVSLGVDAFQDDPISFFTLGTEDFARAGQRLARTELPTVLVMEGGYAIDALGANVVAVLHGFEHG